jgi:uncharacterized protein YbjT (DUF2867 family)
MSRFLVFGANGFVGAAVVTVLKDLNFEYQAGKSRYA